MMSEIQGTVHVVNGKFYKLPYAIDVESGTCRFYKAVAITKQDCFIEGDPEVSKELLEFLKNLIIQETLQRLNRD